MALFLTIKYLLPVLCLADLISRLLCAEVLKDQASKILTMRSPGTISISQEELLGVDQAGTMSVVPGGDIGRVDVQIRPREALQLLTENVYSIEFSDEFDIFSFYFGGFIKTRYFGVIRKNLITIVERMAKDSPIFEVRPDQFVQDPRFPFVEFVPKSVSYYLYNNSFHVVFEINTAKTPGAPEMQWLCLWTLKLVKNENGTERITQEFQSGPVQPVAHPSGMACRDTSTMMQIRAENGEVKIYVFRYCLPPEPETASYLYFYDLSNKQVKSVNYFRILSLEGNSSYLRLQYHSVLSPYVLLFCKENTVYLKMNDLIEQGLSKDTVLKARILNKIENARGECNFMSLGVIGCTTKARNTEPDVNGKYHSKFVFTEFYGFEESIVQYTPMTYIIDDPEEEYVPGPINSINLNHFIVTQISKNSILLTSRKLGVQPKTFTFTGYRFLRLIDFYVEDNLSDKFNGYILVAYRRVLEDNYEFFDVEMALFKVSLPYFEIESNENLLDTSCDRYVSNCLELKVSFTDPDSTAANKPIIEKSIYLVNSAFASILKVRNRNEDLSQLVLNMEHFVDLQQYYSGVITKAQLVGDLGKLVPGKPALPDIMRDDEVLSGSHDGAIIASNIHSFTVKLDIPEMAEPRSNILWSEMKFFKDNSFSLVVFVRREQYEGYSIPTLITTSPRVTMLTQNQTLSSSYRLTFPFEEYKSDWQTLSLDLSRFSQDTIDFLAFRVVNSTVHYVRRAILNNEKLEDNSTNTNATVELRVGEKFQDARAFCDSENSVIATLTSERIILNQIDIRDGFALPLAASLEQNKIGIESEVVVKIVDVLLEGDYLLLDTVVEDELAPSYLLPTPNSKNFTKIFVYRLFKGKRTIQLFGHIATTLKKKPDYHIFFANKFIKIVFVDLLKSELSEYSLDEGIEWLERAVSARTNSLTPICVFNVKSIKELAPDFDRLLMSQDIVRSNSTQTFTAVRRGGHFALRALLGLPSKGNRNDRLRDIKTLLFKITSSDILSLVKTQPRVWIRNSLQSPLVLGEYNKDIFPMVRIFPGSSTATIYLLYTGSYMLVKYSQIFFQEEQKFAKLRIKLSDLAGLNYEDSFLARRDQKYNFVDVSNSSIYSGAYQFKYSELGLLNSAEAYCGEDPTIMRFNRYIEGFSCPKAEFSISVEPGIVRESTLSIDGTTTKAIKHLVLARPVQLGYRSLFILLAEKNLYLFRSIGSTLQNRLILVNKQGQRDDSKVDFSFDNCIRINRVERQAIEGEDSILISLFCSEKTKYAEYEIVFPYRQLVQAEETNTPAVIEVGFRRKWEVAERIWRSVIEEDTHQLMNDTLLIVRSRITLPSIGEKEIIEFYARDNSNYKLALTSLSDKYDSFDVVAFASTSDYSTDPKIIKGEIFQVKLHKKTGEVKVLQSNITYKIAEISGNSTLVYEKLLTPTPTKVFQASIHYLFYSKINPKVILYIVDQDYIYEHYVRQTLLKDSKDGLLKPAFTFKFIRKYNYVGLCSERASFKISPGRDTLKINCIPPENDNSPNNLLIYKRPTLEQMNQDSFRQSPPYNASHILTQVNGYTAANAHHFLISSDDGSEVRLVKTTISTLVNQYKLNGEWRLKIKSHSGVFTRNKIFLNVSNFFTSKAYPIIFDYNQVTIMRRVMDTVEKQLAVILVVAIYLLCFLFLLGTPYLSWVVVTITSWKESIRLNHNLRIRSEQIKLRVGKGIVQGNLDDESNYANKTDSLSLSLIASPMD